MVEANGHGLGGVQKRRITTEEQIAATEAGIHVPMKETGQTIASHRLAETEKGAGQHYTLGEAAEILKYQEADADDLEELKKRKNK